MPTLTDRYEYGDGTPRVGSVRFYPSVTVTGPDAVILPAPLTVPLVDGGFTVDIPACDDPAYSPPGWVWVVEERMTGGREPWAFTITADAVLRDLVALDPAPVFLAGSAVLVLDSGAPVPVGTPTGTVILRRS